MPRFGWVKPNPSERLTDHVSLGVLTRVFPPEVVDAVIDGCGRRESRSRLLPARLTAYFVLGLALFSSDSYDEVIRQVISGLEWESGWARSWEPPSRAALSLARARLGPEVLAGLFERVAAPLGVGPLVGGLVPVAVDGTVLDVPDTPANAREFGRPACGAGVSAYPQVRVLALGECSARAMFAAAVSGLSAGEQTLLPGLLGALGPGMLLLADRGFYSFDLWGMGLATGAQLCWRMKKNSILPVLAELGDGSYLSEVYPGAKARRRGEGAAAVRVVEYTAGDSPFRLITSLLDPAAAPAGELAAAYRARWAIETSFDELKTHQGKPALVLRSQSPDMVRQEVMAHLCVHYAIRKLMAGAVAHAGVDPGRASFVAALRSARRSVGTHPGFSPHSAG
jgi:hypothetical protein